MSDDEPSLELKLARTAYAEAEELKKSAARTLAQVEYERGQIEHAKRLIEQTERSIAARERHLKELNEDALLARERAVAEREAAAQERDARWDQAKFEALRVMTAP